MSEADDNPYVGPRPFDEQDAARGRYHGREHEARDLVALVSRERLVLFYSQSGAGKSSLLRASLIPGLRRLGFDVLPVARVSGARPSDGTGPTTADEATNPIIYNVILSLNEGLPLDTRATPDALLHVSLSQFLEGEEAIEPAAVGVGAAHAVEPVALAARNGAANRDANGTMASGDGAAVSVRGEGELGGPMAPTVLVIDQFEEIVTVYPNRWQERRAFFEQLRDTMDRLPRLWVVLTLREDYVASLEPYAELMPNRLRARYYMQQMGVEAALDAVRKPAEAHHRPFAPGVAEKLVDNLRRVRVQFAGEPELGQYIEPVQLQVVCYELWEQVTQRAAQGALLVGAERVIDEQDLALDYIDQALTRYYQSALAFTEADETVQRLGIDERQLRTWFDREIIAEDGIRNSVLRNEQTGFTGTLPNAAVDRLLGRYLLRAELRAGGSWVELVHDRFVKPIREDNADWFPQHLSALQRQAVIWQDEGREAGLLLQGDALTEAKQWAAAHGHEVKQIEQEFLQASLKEYQRHRRALVQAKRIRWLAIAAVILSLVAILTAFWSIQARSDAESSTKKAEALATSFQARQLATEAGRQLDAGKYEAALLMAVASNAITRSVDAATVLNLALRAPLIPHSIDYMPMPAGSNFGEEWNGDRNRVLATSVTDPKTGAYELDLFDASNSALLLQLPSISLYRWNEARTRLLTADDEDRIRLWDTTSGKQLVQFTYQRKLTRRLEWNNDGSRRTNRIRDRPCRHMGCSQRQTGWADRRR